ncbi:MAG TPA: hypothetical protein PKM71_04320 [Candidatus Cloacimonas sp.]|nr:hypothetical protein [Candidatus Cloacimonas sp.]
MAKKKEELKKDALRSSRIEQVMAMPGWKDIEEIIQGIFNDCMTELLKKENPEARGGINTLNTLMDDISQDLQFGKVAVEKFRKTLL